MFLPQMRKVEAQFLAHTGVYPDCEIPVCDRWTSNLKGCPELAHVSLAGNLTPLFVRGFNEWTGQKLMCLFDAARLRFHLYHALWQSGHVMWHTLLLEQAASEYWANKLLAKATQTVDARRTDGRIRKTKLPDKVITHWLN